MKLIFYHGYDGYVFTDYAQGAALHKTGITIRGHDPGEIPLLVEDVERFLLHQIGKVKVSPIWFPG